MTRVRIIYGLLLSLAISSCMGLNETDPETYLAPQTGDVDVQGNKVLYFTFSSTVGSYDRVKECGFYYGHAEDMAGASRITSSMSSGIFSERILLKDYESDCYVRSFISNGVDEIRSDLCKVTIGPLEDYVDFASPSVDSYMSSTRTASVSVKFDAVDGVEVTEAGFCYGETKDLSLDGAYALAGKKGEDYLSASISGLIAGRQYYVRPFIKDGDDIAYAAVSSLNVNAVPEVETLEAGKITDCSAYLYGNVLDDCGKEILERGFVWDEGDTNPTLSSKSKIVSGTTGEFNAQIDGLEPNTLYSVRAYARNSEGTAYGAVRNFITAVALPSVAIESVSDITSLSAKVYAKVSDDGGEAVSEFGVLLDTSSDVNPDKAKKIKGSGSASSFSVDIDGLSRKTTYYVQAYVINSAGTAYGDVEEFETLAELPAVTTASVTDITDVNAVSGGNITDDGGDEIMARGVVWGKTQDLTVENDAKSSDGKGAGRYNSSITGLRYETVYYVRAYATNSAGTAYGEALKFTTGALDINNVTDLAAAGTANCYIVSESGVYKFPTVKGNSSESVGSVSSAEVLWETFGTSTVPEVGDLVASVAYKDGQIILEIASSFKVGNAVVAAKSSDGTILWSWHIWITDQPNGQTYYNNAGTMMDRNLGATSATPGDVGALGLLYQWGRKDPFLGNSTTNNFTGEQAASTAIWPSYVNSSISFGTIEFTIMNPMTFINSNVNNSDWFYTAGEVTDNTRWQTKKTIYDPCPLGWRVPDGEDNSPWTKAFDSSLGDFFKHSFSSYRGMNFSDALGDSPVIWYPATGYIIYGSDTRLTIAGTGEVASYWSVTPISARYICTFGIDNYNNVELDEFTSRAQGNPVRCVRDVDYPSNTEGLGVSDYEW